MTAAPSCSGCNCPLVVLAGEEPHDVCASCTHRRSLNAQRQRRWRARHHELSIEGRRARHARARRERYGTQKADQR